MIALLLAHARAACPDPVERTAAARRLYDDVELEAARTALDEGLASLACQDRVIATAELLELYRTGALVALTQDEREDVVYLTLRAVAADPVSGRPPDGYGPELQDAYDTWAQRLGQALVTVRVDGGGTVWVDGHATDAMRPLSVVEGEHLVQIDRGDGSPVTSDVRELSADVLISTGVPLLTPPVPEPLPEPEPEPVAPVAPEPPPSGHRRRPAGLWLSTAVTGGLAGFLVGSGYRSELAFLASPYGSQNFQGCFVGDACYAGARAEAIRGDALRIRLAYGAGYGLSAASGGLLVFTLVGLPPR